MAAKKLNNGRTPTQNSSKRNKPTAKKSSPKRTLSKVKRKISNDRKFKKLQSEFVTATSHQFRTPLSTIRSSIDLLELYTRKGNAARQIEILEKLKRSTDYLTEMVEKITAIYKYDPSVQKPNIKKADIRKFVNDLLQDVVINIGDTHFINSSIDSSISVFFCDEFILKQILINLINNSIKFSPNGGEIRLNVKNTKKFIEFSVKDEGVGISKTDLRKLFAPFFRGENAVQVPGVGLGLAIVKNLGRIHKAKIECTSELNKGTEFKILIPIKY